MDRSRSFSEQGWMPEKNRGTAGLQARLGLYLGEDCQSCCLDHSSLISLVVRNDAFSRQGNSNFRTKVAEKREGLARSQYRQGYAGGENGLGARDEPFAADAHVHGSRLSESG